MNLARENDVGCSANTAATPAPSQSASGLSMYTARLSKPLVFFGLLCVVGCSGESSGSFSGNQALPPGAVVPGGPVVAAPAPGSPVSGVAVPGQAAPGNVPAPGTPVSTPLPGQVAPPAPGQAPGQAPAAGPVPVDVQAACAAQQGFAPSPLRRLSHREYENTLRDLLDLDGSYSVNLPADSLEHGFDNNAYLLNVGQLLSDNYVDNAESLARQAVADLPAMLPCAATGGAACAAEFIASFGKRAFRRPLSAEESTGLTELFEVGNNTSFEDGIRLVMTATLASPSFLYRSEVGLNPVAPGGTTELTPYELATRLSYSLIGSMPDAALLEAADNGLLSNKEQVMAHAQRLMATPAARQHMIDFYSQWLSLAKLESQDKDDNIFTPQLRESMTEETRRFVEHVFFEDDARLATLLTAPYSFVDRQLAELYGINAPAAGGFEQTTLPAAQRVGFLTHPSLLAGLAQPNQSDPVLRGQFVREQILCQKLPDPPMNLIVDAPEVAEGVSTRERFLQHQADPACAGCHSLMDDIGFAFENYDELGRWRDTDQGQTIDATGKLIQTLDIDGEFNGVAELAQLLSQSAEVQACAARQWFRFSQGRDFSPGDECTKAHLESNFGTTGGDFRQLVLGLTQTDDFAQKRVEQ